MNANIEFYCKTVKRTVLFRVSYVLSIVKSNDLSENRTFFIMISVRYLKSIIVQKVIIINQLKMNSIPIGKLSTYPLMATKKTLGAGKFAALQKFMKLNYNTNYLSEDACLYYGCHVNGIPNFPSSSFLNEKHSLKSYSLDSLLINSFTIVRAIIGSNNGSW